ncbi:MAG: YihY family inner membrane protein [Granulosicoccaceae bacterium]
MTTPARFLRGIWERFQRADAFSASAALAFSALLALVPLATVMLSMATSAPVFEELGQTLNDFVYEQLVPSAAGNVQEYMQGFVAKAGKLTLWGTALLFFTSLNMLYTLERYLNRIFGNGQRRSMAMRFVVFWAMITLMPLLFGISISLTSYAIAQAQTLIGGTELGLMMGRVAPVVLVAVGFSVLYLSLPNRAITMSAALTGGLVAAVLFEFAKSGFALWAGRAVSYQAIYGAMAILPLFLIWLWACCLVTFVGASVAAEVDAMLSEEIEPMASN